MNIRPVRAELYHEDGRQADRQIDIKKRIVAFRTSGNAPKTGALPYQTEGSLFVTSLEGTPAKWGDIFWLLFMQNSKPHGKNVLNVPFVCLFSLQICLNVID
jgi:hypothetical protein